MAEVKIARFIGIDACMNVFSEKSTFVLRSPEHYRRLYDSTDGMDRKGDRNEGTAETVGGGTADFTDFLVSCWTVLRESEPTRDEWDIFKKDDQNIVAIVTTPGLVAEFLRKAFRLEKDSTEPRFPFRSLNHRRVSYDKQHIDHTNISDIVAFSKSGKFRHEEEYRFVLTYAGPPTIDSLVFCAGYGYMEHRDDGGLCNFANPEMCLRNKRRLLQTLLTAGAGYGDFANAETFQLKNIGDFVRREICKIIANGEILFE
jgi:hypothetical protein